LKHVTSVTAIIRGLTRVNFFHRRESNPYGRKFNRPQSNRLPVDCPLMTAIGRPFFGHKSPAAKARELFKPSTDSASLLVDIEKKRFSFSVGVFWR